MDSHRIFHSRFLMKTTRKEKKIESQPATTWKNWRHIKKYFPICKSHMQTLFPNGTYHFPPTSETLRLRTPTPSWHCSSSITVLSGRGWKVATVKTMDELDWQIKSLLFSPGPFLGVTVADVYLTSICLAQASEKMKIPPENIMTRTAVFFKKFWFRQIGPTSSLKKRLCF